MSLEIDGTTVTSISSNIIDYDWDPGNKDAGNYIAKAIAVDNRGKEAEVSVQFTLDPVLVIKTKEVTATPHAEWIYVSWYVYVDITGKGFSDSFNLFWTDDGSEPNENTAMIPGITIESYNHEILSMLNFFYNY